MKTLFADTGYWIALLNPRDNLHERAKQLATQLAPFRIVTTEMVLVEFLTSVSAGGQQLRQRAAETVRSLKIDPNVEVVPQTSNQFEDALDLYASRPDQQWSLTDCASFVLMRQRYLWEALAEDHNFEQAKFAALLS